jgi:hypothetical protein
VLFNNVVSIETSVDHNFINGYGRVGGNGNWQRKQKYLEKNFPNATLYTTNPTWNMCSNTSMEEPTSRALLPTCFMLVLLLGLFFKAEDGGNIFFKNVG